MAGGRHGVSSENIGTEFGIYLKTHPHGVVCTEVNFKLIRNERIPDVAFVAAEHVPDGMPEGVVGFAPELAVEVISPNDVHDQVGDKVLEIWLVSPKLRSVTIFRSLIDVQVFAGDNELISEDLLPGFRCSLREIFQTSASNPQV